MKPLQPCGGLQSIQPIVGTFQLLISPCPVEEQDTDQSPIPTPNLSLRMPWEQTQPGPLPTCWLLPGEMVSCRRHLTG